MHSAAAFTILKDFMIKIMSFWCISTVCFGKVEVFIRGVGVLIGTTVIDLFSALCAKLFQRGRQLFEVFFFSFKRTF